MKERPIPFTGESVRSILAGHKTQTRRVVKPQPCPQGRLLGNIRDGRPLECTTCHDAIRNPYGQSGDRLWVRETWAPSVIDPEGGSFEEDPRNFDIVYRADGDDAYWAAHWTRDTVVRGRAVSVPCAPTWRSPRFMPRWASRLTLEVTGVRLERVQDISEDDAVAEGITRLERGKCAARAHYRILWNALNAKRGHGWDTNPWVWVIEFQRADVASGVRHG